MYQVSASREGTNEIRNKRGGIHTQPQPSVHPFPDSKMEKITGSLKLEVMQHLHCGKQQDRILLLSGLGATHQHTLKSKVKSSFVFVCFFKENQQTSGERNQ